MLIACYISFVALPPYIKKWGNWVNITETVALLHKLPFGLPTII